MKVERLIVGWFTSPAGIWRRGDDMERQVRFPVPAYVIETGRERILVDTGLHPGAVADPAAHYGSADSLALFKLEQKESVADQLELRSLTSVVLTHLHFDHAGALSLLPDSIPIVVQRREWEAGRSREAVERNFLLPRDYRDAEDQVVLVDGDHDLLGDGSVELLLTPGHTPGHQSVRIAQRLVIGADVLHYASTLDDRRFPLFGDDLDAQAASAERLSGLRDAGATVLPGHDPEALRPGPVAVR
ncbi:MAG TPA: N-acyl homoserine lactonase family protein [Solirubrobacterales bacterium]